MELWKPVKDFENLYEVSNLGRVKSLTRSVRQSAKNDTTSIHVYEGRILKPFFANYYQVTLVKDNIKYSRNVHVLVAEAFLEKPKNMNNIVINHKNGFKKDNRANNLEYITQSENVKHSYRLGLQKVMNRKKVYCIELHKEFDCAKSAVEWLIKNDGLITNIDTAQRNIRHCCSGKRQIAYKYHWEFV